MIKRILYITDVRLSTEKAHGLQIMKSCEAFSNVGIAVELIIPDRENPIKQDPFEYYDVEKKFKITKIKTASTLKFEKVLGPLAFWIQAMDFLRKLPKITTDSETIIYTRSVEIAWFLALKGLKVTYEAHTWPTSKKWLYKAMLRPVDYIVCNSKGTESEYKKAGFKRTVAVPNGVDLEKFKVESRKSKVDETKEKLNLPLDKKIIMYTGHLYAWKGVDTVIEAAKLCSNYSQIIFVFVGGTEKDLLKYQKIKESQSLTNVLFVGHREQKEVPEYLACADVLLLPNVPLSVESEHYTSPIKMFEYMASGKPVVASDLPSIREVLNEKNSILVKPADATDLIRGINEALENPIHTREITREALMNVENYTWIKRAERIISYLNQ